MPDTSNMQLSAEKEAQENLPFKFFFYFLYYAIQICVPNSRYLCALSQIYNICIILFGSQTHSTLIPFRQYYPKPKFKYFTIKFFYKVETRAKSKKGVAFYEVSFSAA